MTAVDTSQSLPIPVQPAVAAPPTEQHGFTFHDLLDIVNPLQHLPVISTLYCKLTGEKIGTPEKIIGDGIYGGLWGLASSVADTAFEKLTGKDFADTVLSLFDSGKTPTTAVAAKAPQVSPLDDISSTPPTLVASAAETSPTPAAPMSEQQVTASLNRAQLDKAVAARVAYARATTLIQPKIAVAVAL